VGSYATVAPRLDQLETVEGMAGVMLTFDDFIVGMRNFGERIQPLMASRRTQGHSGGRVL
jgi:pyrimidine oxygenase